MDKPKINMIKIEVGSFMEAYDSLPDKMKPVVELKAYEHYQDVRKKMIDGQAAPFEDAPFLINVMRMLLASMKEAEPETYQKALDMFPEEEFREGVSKTVKEEKEHD